MSYGAICDHIRILKQIAEALRHSVSFLCHPESHSCRKPNQATSSTLTPEQNVLVSVDYSERKCSTNGLYSKAELDAMCERWAPGNNGAPQSLAESAHCSSARCDASSTEHADSDGPVLYAARLVRSSSSARASQRPHQFSNERCVLACGWTSSGNDCC